MDHEQQIKKLRAATEQFLPLQITDENDHRAYSFESEFEKSRKNKNYRLPALILLFIIILSGSAYYYSYLIDEENRAIKISNNEFEDLRVQELINLLKQSESALDLLDIGMERLSNEKNAALLDINIIAQKKRNLVIAKNLPTQLEQLELAKLQQEFDSEYKLTTRDYDDKIEKHKKKIAEITTAIAERDAAARQNSAQSGVVSDNSGKLQNLKLNNIKNSYAQEIEKLKNFHQRYIDFLTTKYNPPFQSQHILSLIDQSANTTEIEFRRLPYSPILQQESIFNEEAYNQLQQLITDRQLLMARLEKIEYQQPIPASINKLDRMNRRIVRVHGQLWSSLAQTVEHKNNIINEQKNTIKQNVLTIQKLKQQLSETALNYGFIRLGDSNTGLMLDFENSPGVTDYTERTTSPTESGLSNISETSHIAQQLNNGMWFCQTRREENRKAVSYSTCEQIEMTEYVKNRELM